VNSFDIDYRLIMIPTTSFRNQPLTIPFSSDDVLPAQHSRIPVFPSYFRNLFRALARRTSAFPFFSFPGETLLTPEFHWVPAFVAIV
jgi:hypothetical protein